MSHNFWRFASTLEKGFHVPYNRDIEAVTCPECKAIISNSELICKDKSYALCCSESVVLLKNEGTLPPEKGRKLRAAFFCPRQRRPAISSLCSESDPIPTI